MSTSHPASLTLYRGWDLPGQYVWSPFVTKLEFRLRLGGAKYTAACGSTRSGPTGKIPYVEVREEGGGAPEVIGDSALIAGVLVDRGVMGDLERGAGGRERAVGAAVRALLEERLYFFNMRERWLDNFYTTRDHVLASRPYPLRLLIGWLIHRSHVQTLAGQGTGRFSDEQASRARREVWDHVEALLGESWREMRTRVGEGREGKEPFWCLGGQGPTEADTVVYGFVVSSLICSSNPESQDVVRGLPAVMEYVERIHARYFPDYEKWPDA